MRILLSVLFVSLELLCSPSIWVNHGPNEDQFRSHVYSENDISMADYLLIQFDKRSVDQNLLLEKTDFWSKNKTSAGQLDSELYELQKANILNASNRLVLFEFLKQEASSAKSLCHLYSNDSYIKTAEPFFESSCGLARISLKDINPTLLSYDYMLIDGNKINIQQSPYFFSSGTPHQFVFISNRYTTQEVTATTKSLKTLPITLTPWIEGSCDHIVKDNTGLSEPVSIYFSKDCIQDKKNPSSSVITYLNRNKYYIISGLIIAAVALSISSQYDLGVTLP